ncbi:MAG: hypothetical protein H0T73_06250 [Ardenticatenales bacterium]|nr:hypothetical protein [Ardenticatenales bacterium]
MFRRALPFLTLLFFTLLLTWPTAATLTTHVVDRQDPLLNGWIMAWEARQLLVDPLHLYDANIFFPLRNTLAFSEILLSTSALVMPLQWFTDDALLSYNVAFLLSFFTTALGAYLLALYLSGRRDAALVAAVAFAWSPYRMGHLSQVQLLAFGWLPMALIYLDRLLRSGKVKGKSDDNGKDDGGGLGWVRDGFLFGGFFLLQALASFYAALFSAMACVFYVGAWLVWQRRLAWQSVAGAALAALLVLLVMVPLVLPYFEVQRTLGAGWTLAQNEQFSASLQAYGYAPEGTVLWGALTRPLHYVYGPCCPPDTLFPGLTVLVLGGLALRYRGGRRGLWLGLALLAFLLSLGPTLTLQATKPTGIALPYRWLWEVVPGFNAIRAPVRWAVLVTLALSMLAALGLARFRGRWAAPLALALVLLEFAVFPLRLVPMPEPPASLGWLDEQPPSRFLELPLVADRAQPRIPEDQPRLAWEQSRLLEAQFFSTYHWHTTPDGYSGYVPVRHGDFAREMQTFPSERSVALLQGLGVRYVVVHADEPAAQHLASAALPLPDGINEVAHFEAERVFEIASSPAAPLPEIQLPLDRLPPQQRVDLPLRLTTSELSYVPLGGEPMTVMVEWRQEGQPSSIQQLSVPLPMIVDEVAVLSLPLQTPPPGDWRLVLSGAYPGQEQPHEWRLEQPMHIAADASTLPDLLPVRLVRAQALDTTTVELTWQSHQPLARYYSLSARLLAADGSVIAQQDGVPAGVEGTLSWLPGERYSATWHFNLPPGSTVSDYRLALLWYDPERGTPAWLWDGTRFVEQLEIP